MAGRPPLAVGTNGRITVVDISPPGAKRNERVWEARTRYRDADGETRKVKRTGRSKDAAENALKKALSERRHAAGATITPDSRLRDAARQWISTRQSEVDAGDLSPNTFDRYECAWRLHLDPALGGLRLRELNVARCEAWKVAMRANNGAGITRTARTVLSGILGYCARLGAIPMNPARELSRIPSGPKKQIRALTADERRAWLLAVEGSERASRWDVPDLTRMMLATGCRIGEALAVSWDEVDLEAGAIAVRWRLIRVKGKGLHRISGAKSLSGNRVVRVPSWAVDMLIRRRLDENSGYPVFPDSLGGWRWPNNMGKIFREERGQPGFEWVTSHVFRKTTLTILDDAKLTPRQIADVAGHSDPSMTQRVYMARGVASEEAAGALEGMFSSGTEKGA